MSCQWFTAYQTTSKSTENGLNGQWSQSKDSGHLNTEDKDNVAVLPWMKGHGLVGHRNHARVFTSSRRVVTVSRVH